MSGVILGRDLKVGHVIRFWIDHRGCRIESIYPIHTFAPITHAMHLVSINEPRRSCDASVEPEMGYELVNDSMAGGLL